MLNRQRIINHLVLFFISTLLLLFFYWLIPGDDKMYLSSMATAYTGIILLAITLGMGPYRVWQNLPNPVSTHLRRDTGIWCGIVSLLHVVVGIQVHMGNILLYFVKAVEGPEQYVWRNDFFGFANYTGLIATLIMVVLLVISNDLSLRKLGTQRWKNLQRWVYPGFLLILIHGISFQLIEKRKLPLVMLCAIILAIGIIFQTLGFIMMRKRQ